MQKILMVTERYIPIWGGAENQLRQLIPHLVRSGNEVTVVTRRWSDDLPKYEEVDQVPVHRLGVPGRYPLTTGLFIIELLFFLIVSGRKFDWLHSHGVVNMGVLCRVAAFFSGVKNIAKIATAGKVKPLQRTLSGRGLLWLFKQSTAVVCMTSEIREELDSIGFPKQAMVSLPNAVDGKRFYRESNPLKRQQFRESIGVELTAQLVLFSGRLVQRKGVDLLIDAWQRLYNQNPEWYLLILGSGAGQIDSVEEEIKNQVVEQGVERVLFLGESDRPQFFLANCDVFVFPSRLEGFPNALMEAMAAELPVVASHIGGNCDLVVDHETGLLFEKDNLSDLVGSLEQLIVDRQLRIRLGKRAREEMVKRYSFETIAALYERVYGEMEYYFRR
ncbi:glycosyltransferase family 4 protein [Desulfogranum marinum]|uniref:glycosyltransferase family 4 protein n=1 Tax=Desulfogranum marinum TaxID=453220 RepID=UPI0019658237|nr:glycosyltransferase family 4 protein [Desulfogranum marinum]MBM9513009.1 glycosyltransferase family 4 protein [Desulfogranum marinum]